ncbi:MAG: AAA family ATPase [Patescibacteria group bacterium]|nr:AAA family ATPase [Patescibacteria group bacterium]
MPESSSESFSTQQIQQARYRVAPLSVSRFTENLPLQENPEHLSNENVEDRCFAVLGYMEEYFRPSAGDTSKIQINGDISLRDLEAQLDDSFSSNKRVNAVRQVFTGASQNEVNNTTSDQTNNPDHRKEIKTKIGEILSHPQVREKFQEELAREVGFYQAARKPMKDVRDIDRVAGKLRQAIYTRYLSSKRDHGKLVQSTADQITQFQGKVDGLESTRKGIEQTASAETLGYLETQKLLEYKRQLRESRVVLTPSRIQLIDRIKREAIAGNKIFLVGSTGTGKTQLGIYVLNSLTGGYEIVNWHEGTTPRDLFGYRELWTGEDGNVQSAVRPGPIPRALERRVGYLGDEYTGGATRTQLAEKFMMGAKPGDQIQIPGFNGQVFDITENFITILTGNPKDERTKQREEMDPAILRELTGVEVSYMPASEMNDIILAKLIEENGVLKLGASELKYIEKLCKAAELMQKVHNRDFEGLKPEIKTALGIDPQGNTETTLNTNFLDPGTLFKLFSEWELAQARGQNFGEYMQSKLGEFVRDPKTLSTPEERKTLQKILSAFDLITNASGEIKVTINKPAEEKGYVLPSEMAGAVALSSENPMGTASSETTSSSEFQRDEEQSWRDKLKPASGSVFEIPELPRSIPLEALEKFANDTEHIGVRSIPKLDIGTPDDLRRMDVDDFLARIEERYPGLRVYESLSPAERDDHTVGRLLRKWYWEEVKSGKIDFPEIYNKGGWFVTEVMPKPMSRDTYDETMISAELGHTNRFNVTWDTAHGDIVRNKSEILSKLGLPSNLEVRMPTAAELNMLLNRMEVGTNTYEWTEDEYRDGGGPVRVLVGHSGPGGAARARWLRPSDSLGYVGFRVVVVLGT